MRIVARLLGIILALIVTAWLIGSVTAKTASNDIQRETWPAGLGTLASVEGRVRPQTTNDAARQLASLAKPLQISFEMPPPRNRVSAPVNGVVMDHLKAEHARADATIGAAPAEVVAYLAAHEKEIDAVRDHLLRAETIQWDLQPSEWLDAPAPNFVGHMHLARLLTVRALEYGHAKDPRAWDDLHAAWRLGRSLEARPELISQMIFLAIARSVNAVAWKLPQPEAPWFAEVQNVDHRQLFLRAHQHETWVAARHSSNTLHGIGGFLAEPFFRWATVSFTRHQRETATQVAAATACAFDGGAFAQARFEAIPRWNIFAQIATPNLGAMWQRMFRTMAEREATANAMRIAHGQPIVAQSACSDGAWKYENGRLSFSRDLPKSNSAESVMPLSLAISARATPRST
ncbi:MAG TPA: hypothetical protein VFV49_08465 [Thermoanaerobaculia bacterium]|nr:hypothetical protein [Thermoanaerobaculia bacterium]